MSSAAFLLAAALLAPTNLGRVVLVEGEVSVRPADVEGYAVLAVGSLVAVGDTLRTGDGRVRLLLHNRSVVDLAPDSELVLRAVEGEAQQSRITLRAVLGRLWARVASDSGAERLSIETETAVAGVRGTSLLVEAAADGAAVTVEAGEVELRPNDAPAFALGARQRAVLASGAWSVERDLSVGVLAELRARVETPRRLGAAAAQRFQGLRARIAAKPGFRAALVQATSGRRGERMRAALRRAWQRHARGDGSGLDIDPGAARRVRSFLLGLMQPAE